MTPIVLVVLPSLALHRSASFKHLPYRCDSVSIPAVDSWLDPIYASTLIFLPMVIVTVTTLWLLRLLYKSRGLQKQSVLTLLLISTLFFLSFVPHGIFFVLSLVFDVSQSAPLQHYYRFTVFIINLNSMGNAFLYYLSIASYTKFIKQAYYKTRLVLCGTAIPADIALQLRRGTLDRSQAYTLDELGGTARITAIIKSSMQ